MSKTTTPISDNAQRQVPAAPSPLAHKSGKCLLAALGAQACGLLAALMFTLAPAPAQAQIGLTLETIGLTATPTVATYRISGATMSITAGELDGMGVFSARVIRSAVADDGSCRPGVLGRGATCRYEDGVTTPTLTVRDFQVVLRQSGEQATGINTERVSVGHPDLVRITGISRSQVFDYQPAAAEVASGVLKVPFSVRQLFGESEGEGYIVVDVEGDRYRLTDGDGNPNGPHVTFFSFGGSSSSSGGGALAAAAIATLAVLFFSARLFRSARAGSPGRRPAGGPGCINPPSRRRRGFRNRAGFGCFR